MKRELESERPWLGHLGDGIWFFKLWNSQGSQDYCIIDDLPMNIKKMYFAKYMFSCLFYKYIYIYIYIYISTKIPHHSLIKGLHLKSFNFIYQNLETIQKYFVPYKNHLLLNSIDISIVVKCGRRETIYFHPF